MANKISTSKFLEFFHNSKDKIDNQEISIAINSLRNNMLNHIDGDINLNLDNLSCFENSAYGYINIAKSNDIDTGIKQVIMNKSIKNSPENILIHFNLPSSCDMIEVSDAMDQVYEIASEEASVCLCISYNKLREKNDIEIHTFLFF